MGVISVQKAKVSISVVFFFFFFFFFFFVALNVDFCGKSAIEGSHFVLFNVNKRPSQSFGLFGCGESFCFCDSSACVSFPVCREVALLFFVLLRFFESRLRCCFCICCVPMLASRLRATLFCFGCIASGPSLVFVLGEV